MRIERHRPLRDRHGVDEFVSVTLNTQPWAGRRTHGRKVPTAYRRGNRDQSFRGKLPLSPQGNPCTERKPAEPQRLLWPLRPRPLHHASQIVTLTAAFVVCACGGTHTTKIESHGHGTRSAAGACQCVHDFVGERAAEQGVRMAAHRHRTRHGVLPRRIDEDFELTCRPCDQLSLRGADESLPLSSRSARAAWR